MNWFCGRLEATCIKGNKYVHHDVTTKQAQVILDTQFEDRLQDATYYPAPISMKSVQYRNWTLTSYLEPI